MEQVNDGLMKWLTISFLIHYKPGSENNVADSLSRFPIQPLTNLSGYK